MHSIAYRIWRSSMKMIELWPRFVFGPYSTNRFGKPLTVMPRSASAPSFQLVVQIERRRGR